MSHQFLGLSGRIQQLRLSTLPQMMSGYRPLGAEGEGEGEGGEGEARQR